MEINDLDQEYLDLVKDIINDKRFLKLKECEHHGITRFEHSLKVSYKSYKYAKKHGLNYKEVAVGGLLHDFFNDKNYGFKKRLVSTFTHPNKAAYNAVNTFNVNKKEKDIIKSHMFPLNLNIPHCKESWVVSLYDKKVAVSELVSKLGFKIQHICNIVLLLLFNFI